MPHRHYQSREQIIAEPIPDGKLSTSDLKGFFSYSMKDGNKYRAQITTGGKTYNLGNYDLRSDAALAHDLAAKLLDNCGKLKRATNFAREQEHQSLRAVEMRQTGLSVDFKDVQAYMTMKRVPQRSNSREATAN